MDFLDFLIFLKNVRYIVTTVQIWPEWPGCLNLLEQLLDSYDSDRQYQTLDPLHHHVGEGDMLVVMLPSGEVVAATLVRQARG